MSITPSNMAHLLAEGIDSDTSSKEARGVDSNLISVMFLRQQRKISIPRGDSGPEDWPVSVVVVTLKEFVLVVV